MPLLRADETPPFFLFISRMLLCFLQYFETMSAPLSVEPSLTTRTSIHQGQSPVQAHCQGRYLCYSPQLYKGMI